LQIIAADAQEDDGLLPGRQPTQFIERLDDLRLDGRRRRRTGGGRGGWRWREQRPARLAAISESPTPRRRAGASGAESTEYSGCPMGGMSTEQIGPLSKASARAKGKSSVIRCPLRLE
jgi:hypothetical protein